MSGTTHDDSAEQVHKRHVQPRAGKSADKKKLARARRYEGGKAAAAAATPPLKDNVKAFVGRGHAKVGATHRALDREQVNLHLPSTQQIKREWVPTPPPVVIGVVGPPRVGKSTLIRSLVRLYARQTLTTDTPGPVTVVAGRSRRVTLVECSSSLPAMCDVARVADLILLLVDASYGFEMETFEDRILSSDIVNLRTWKAVSPEKFYNPVTDLLQNWVALKTQNVLRKEHHIPIPTNRDSRYVDTAPRAGKSFHQGVVQLPSSLARALPFETRQKMAAAGAGRRAGEPLSRHLRRVEAVTTKVLSPQEAQRDLFVKAVLEEREKRLSKTEVSSGKQQRQGERRRRRALGELKKEHRVKEAKKKRFQKLAQHGSRRGGGSSGGRGSGGRGKSQKGSKAKA